MNPFFPNISKSPPRLAVNHPPTHYHLQLNCSGSALVETEALLASSRDKGSSSSPAMDNETYVKNRIQELVRLIKVARVYRQDNVPSLIQQGLYLGSFAAASNKNALKSCNVTHILTVASSLRPVHPGDFVYKVVPVVDKEDTNLEAYFDECIHFIDEAKKQGGSVLVHCFVGKSRSVTIVVAYLMKKHGMTLTQALQHVQSIRPVANPNAGFIRQLQDLEKSLQVKEYLSDQNSWDEK
uniref:Dual specificity protein phosphatase 1 n=1 Tax=Brassica campestris TaxID=3711 RepID=A0A3P5ZWF8_BRACM|nr:unnamed protein product [Brassica rapa]